MSNRLEQEFPKILWRASPQLAGGGIPVEVMRAYMERARALRSRVIRRSARRAAAALPGALLAPVALLRSASASLFAAHTRASDCRAGPTHRA
jgi:hypothetical protein